MQQLTTFLRESINKLPGPQHSASKYYFARKQGRRDWDMHQHRVLKEQGRAILRGLNKCTIINCHSFTTTIVDEEYGQCAPQLKDIQLVVSRKRMLKSTLLGSLCQMTPSETFMVNHLSFQMRCNVPFLEIFMTDLSASC